MKLHLSTCLVAVVVWGSLGCQRWTPQGEPVPQAPNALYQVREGVRWNGNFTGVFRIKISRNAMSFFQNIGGMDFEYDKSNGIASLERGLIEERFRQCLGGNTSNANYFINKINWDGSVILRTNRYKNLAQFFVYDSSFTNGDVFVLWIQN